MIIQETHFYHYNYIHYHNENKLSVQETLPIQKQCVLNGLGVVRTCGFK